MKLVSIILALAVVLHTCNATDFSVAVSDAKTGQPVSGADCALFSGRYGTLYSTDTSSPMGMCEFSILAPSNKANFEVRVEVANYHTVTKKFTGSDINSGKSVHVQLNPKSDPSTISKYGGFRVVLSWGDYVADLDSYLLDPSGCMVSFDNLSCDRGTQGSAILDVDDTSYFGPETIHLQGATEGVYSYLVNIYSSGYCFDDGIQANVKIWSDRDGGLVHDLNVPRENPEAKCLGDVVSDNCNAFWHVANYDSTTQSWKIVNQFMGFGDFIKYSPDQSVASVESSDSCTCSFGGSSSIDYATTTQMATAFKDSLLQLEDKLCASTLKSHIESLPFTGKSISSGTYHQGFKNGLNTIWQKRRNLIEEIKNDLVTALEDGNKGDQLEECCSTCEKCVFNSELGISTALGEGCVRFVDGVEVETPGLTAFQRAGERWAELHKTDPSLKWVYAATFDTGTYVNFPRLVLPENAGCGGFDPRMRPWAAEAVSGSKRIVIVLDISSSSASERAEAKQGVLNTLRTMSSHDVVNLVLASGGQVRTAADFVLDSTQPADMFQVCQGTSMIRGSTRNLELFQKLVEDAVPFGSSGQPSDYGLALEHARSMLDSDQQHNSWSGDAFDNDVIIVIGSSNPSTFSTESSITSALEPSVSTPNQAKLFVYPFGSNAVDVEAFFCPSLATVCGTITGDISIDPALYYTHDILAANKEGEIVTTAFYFDALGLGMVTSLAIPIYINGNLNAIVALDVSTQEIVAELVAETTQSSSSSDGVDLSTLRSYGFVVDKRGQVIYHPLLPRPEDVKLEPRLVDVTDVETALEVEQTILPSIKLGNNGQVEVTHSYSLPRGDSSFDGFIVNQVTYNYQWSTIQDTDLVLITALEPGEASNKNLVFPTPRESSGTSLYHRWDLDEEYSTQPSNSNPNMLYERSGVFVSSRSTNNAGKWRASSRLEPEILENFEKLMQTSNPSVEDLELIDDVFLTKQAYNDIIMSQVLDECWTDESSATYQDRVWQYFASPRGIFRMFPAFQWMRNYDPTTRPWYLQSVANGPETYTFSTPYLDGGGAGEVITISKAVEGETAQLGVIAFDWNVSQLKAFLQRIIPSCFTAEISCMLMNDNGFLVFHEDFVQSNGDQSTFREHVFVSQKNADIATVLVTQGILVPDTCVDYTTESEKTMYSVNRSAASISQTHNLDCGSFVAKPIDSTNLIILAINGNGCAQQSLFTCLPCNVENCATLDTSRLLCQPCSCQVYYDSCISSFPVNTTQYVCPVKPAAQTFGAGSCDPLDSDFDLLGSLQDWGKKIIRFVGFGAFGFFGMCGTLIYAKCRRKQRVAVAAHNPQVRHEETPMQSSPQVHNNQAPTTTQQQPVTQPIVTAQVVSQQPMSMQQQQPMMMQQQQPMMVVQQQPMVMMQQQPMMMMQQQPMMVQQQQPMMMQQQQPMMMQHTQQQQPYQ